MMISLRYTLLAIFLSGISVSLAAPTFAQVVEPSLEVTSPEDVVQESPSSEGSFEKRLGLNDPKVTVQELSSLFLTKSEEDLIVQARNGLVTRPPTDSEFAKEQREGGASVSGPRELSLGGILYVSSKDWVIWLNSEKITPKNIPSSVIDVRVTKDYVRLKWFDSTTNQIFPIKLRTHQRFNLDTRIFLPG